MTLETNRRLNPLIVPVIINACIVVTAIVFATLKVSAVPLKLLTAVIFISAIITVFCGSEFERALHKHLMHKKRHSKWTWLNNILNYAHTAHERVHHRDFLFDHTFHALDGENTEKIPMAWWNGPILVIANSLPFWILGLILSTWFNWIWIVPATATTTIAFMFFMYEYTHWCMHYPKNRWIERTAYFLRAKIHHWGHHRYMTKNLNVVWPAWADYLHGSYRRTTYEEFLQATRAPVSDVQPSSTQTRAE